jgi:hypothetical protein
MSLLDNPQIEDEDYEDEGTILPASGLKSANWR